MHTILAATKRSSASAEAVALAIELAAAHRAELILVHVVPTLDVGFVDDEDIAIAHEPTDADHEVLRDAATTARDHGVSTTTLLLRGPTAEEIVAAAEEHDADLIVVSSRGHGALASALLGNVSLRVLRRSNRPVLIARRSAARRRMSPSQPSDAATPAASAR